MPGRDRTTAQATSFEEECGNQTARYHKTTTTRYDHVYDNTSTRSAYVRAGALVPPPNITRVGPGKYPQYTRVWYAREAVGSSPHRNHRTTATRLTTSPTHSTRLTSCAKKKNNSMSSVHSGECQDGPHPQRCRQRPRKQKDFPNGRSVTRHRSK